MSSSFQVDVAQIRDHSATVGQLAGQLSSAAGTMPGALSGNALGTFVQFLTGGLSDAMAKTKDAMTTVASTVSDVSNGLTQTADRYQSTEQGNTTRLNGVTAK